MAALDCRRVLASAGFGNYWLRLACQFRRKLSVCLPPRIWAFGRPLSKERGARSYWESPYFNSSLWTMKFELFGSGVVFLVAVALIATRSVITQVTILLVVAGLLCMAQCHLPDILGGPCDRMAANTFQNRNSQTRRYSDDCRGGVSIWVLFQIPQVPKHLLTSTDGCLSKIPSTFTDVRPCLFWRRSHSCRRSVVTLTEAGVLLGRYSFPVYLIHILVIMSLGMFIFVHFEPIIGFPTASAITVLVSLFGITMAATALMFVEEWWVKVVGKIADLMLGPKAKVDPARARA